MRPGKPLTFAEISAQVKDSECSKTILAFGLPGNPVSCIIGFNLFVIPAIRQLSGWSNPQLQRLLSAHLLLFCFLWFISFCFALDCSLLEYVIFDNSFL